MKLLPLAAGSFFGAVILIAASCNKDIRDVIYQPRQAPATWTAAARNWYLQHREAKSTGREQEMMARYWKKAEVLRTDDNKAILVVPLPDPPVDNKALSFRRFLVFEPAGTEIANGKIVELLGDQYQVNNQAGLLLAGHASGTVPGFNGTILQYDVNYNPLGNTSYVRGKEKTSTWSSIVRISGRNLQSPVRPHAEALTILQLRPGRYSVNNHIYNVKGADPYKTLRIEENDSLISAFFYHPQNHGLGESEPAGQESIAHSFTKVLGNARIRQLAASGADRFLITLYFAASEEKIKPAAICFTIYQPAKNSMTLDEIDRVCDYMKKNMALEIPPSANREKMVWPMAQSIDLSRWRN